MNETEQPDPLAAILGLLSEAVERQAKAEFLDSVTLHVAIDRYFDHDPGSRA